MLYSLSPAGLTVSEGLPTGVGCRAPGCGLWGDGVPGVGCPWGLLGLSGLAAPEAEPLAAQAVPGCWPLGAGRVGTRSPWGPCGGTDVASEWHVEGGACAGSIYCWALATSPWKPAGRTRHVTAEHWKKAFPSCSSSRRASSQEKDQEAQLAAGWWRALSQNALLP